MTALEYDRNPEPVPAASQIAVLPFIAGVEGFLRGSRHDLNLRVTLHRAMNREGREYLQQICPYVGPSEREARSGSGRLFPVNFGIIGASFGRSEVLRTRRFNSEDEARNAIRGDMERNREEGDVMKKRLSWLAVPFLGPDDEPVLVLFADANELNFFAIDERTSAVVDMCWGFCRLIDNLEEEPFPNLRNIGFDPGEKVKEADTVYTTVQESMSGLPVPRFRNLRSFNYELPLG